MNSLLQVVTCRERNFRVKKKSIQQILAWICTKYLQQSGISHITGYMQLLAPRNPVNLFKPENAHTPFYCHTKNSTPMFLQILTILVAGIKALRWLPIWMNRWKNKYHYSNIQTIWQEWRVPVFSCYITHKCLAPETNEDPVTII